MCQTCVDEGRLSQETYDKIEAFCEKWDSAEFGPAHILLSDCNVYDDDIQFCLKNARDALIPTDYYLDSPWYEDHEPGETEATIAFLEELLEVPEDVR